MYKGRPCNVRKTRTNNAWSKQELYDEAAILGYTHLSTKSKKDLAKLICSPVRPRSRIIPSPRSADRKKGIIAPMMMKAGGAVPTNLESDDFESGRLAEIKAILELNQDLDTQIEFYGNLLSKYGRRKNLLGQQIIILTGLVQYLTELRDWCGDYLTMREAGDEQQLTRVSDIIRTLYNCTKAISTFLDNLMLFDLSAGKIEEIEHKFTNLMSKYLGCHSNSALNLLTLISHSNLTEEEDNIMNELEVLCLQFRIRLLN